MAIIDRTDVVTIAHPGDPRAGIVLNSRATSKTLSAGAFPIAPGSGTVALLGGADVLKAAPTASFGFLPPTPGIAGKLFAPPSNHGSAVAAPLAPGPAAQGIMLDGSLGQTQQPVISTNADGHNDYAIYGTMGKQVGSNLFFSFSSFSLATNESATFSGPFSDQATAIQNILARVTGGSASWIDGTIRSTIPGASLFLMNPAGVIFGQNAHLDIGGSLVVSTADYIKLVDGARFDALPGANDAGLSTAAVTAFGFVKSTPNGVQFYASQLSVEAGTGIHVIAGDIVLDGASINAPSGALTMFSAASSGEVPFSLSAPGRGYSTANFSALGSISLINLSTASIGGSGGGSLVIRSGNLTVDNSTISSLNQGTIPGGAFRCKLATGCRCSMAAGFPPSRVAWAKAAVRR